jgi:phage-related protein
MRLAADGRRHPQAMRSFGSADLAEPKLRALRAAGFIFTLFKSLMILLHGFVKKTKKTRRHDLNLAKNRMRKFLHNAQT